MSGAHMANEKTTRWFEMLGELAERSSWKALAPLLDSTEFEELEASGPPRGIDVGAALSRRGLLKILGASLAFAGITDCAPQEPERILPYTDSPPGSAPGIIRRYATSMTLEGFATGLLVDSYAGRPIKIEGN